MNDANRARYVYWFTKIDLKFLSVLAEISSENTDLKLEEIVISLIWYILIVFYKSK